MSFMNLFRLLFVLTATAMHEVIDFLNPTSTIIIIIIHQHCFQDKSLFQVSENNQIKHSINSALNFNIYGSSAKFEAGGLRL